MVNFVTNIVATALRGQRRALQQSGDAGVLDDVAATTAFQDDATS
jgi:hypothetical protein